MYRLIERNLHCIHSDSIDNIETLYYLKLICCYFSLSLKSLQFLKCLSLAHVHVVPDFIKRLLKSSMVLESLTLEDCSSINNFIIKGSNKFRILSIIHCGDIILVTTSNSSVSTFYYDGAIVKIKFVDA